MTKTHAVALYWLCMFCIAMSVMLFVVVVFLIAGNGDYQGQPIQYDIVYAPDPQVTDGEEIALVSVVPTPQPMPITVIDDVAVMVVSGRYAELGAIDQIETSARDAEQKLGKFGGVTRARGEQFDQRGILEAMAARLLGHKRVILYITTHGVEFTRNGRLVDYGLCLDCDRGQMLSPDDLDLLFDYLQQNSTEQILVIVEACYSGNVVNALRGRGRTIVTSSGSSDRSMGGVFSREFIGCLVDSGDLNACFEQASSGVAQYDQHPKIVID